MTILPPKRSVDISGARIAYVDSGSGAPILFLHGNPTSSYLWRNIIAPLSSHYRCIAPDLIGMGDSEKLSGGPQRYSFGVHQHYLDAFIESLNLEQTVVLVVHDWGSALGFEWMRRYPERVRAVVYMEAILGVREWDEMPPQARELFGALRSDQGERMILEENVFVEKLLPLSMIRTLSSEEHDEYRRPFREAGEARRPTLTFPRELPIGGEPREICEMVEGYVAMLSESRTPKLFVNAEPGRLLVGKARDRCRRFPNQHELTVRGLHFVQEDSPVEIATAISEFLGGLQ